MCIRDRFYYVAFTACSVDWLGGTGGKLAVLGSAHVFSDQYIDKEDNDKVREIIFSFLTSNSVKLNLVDADDPEVLFWYFMGALFFHITV